MDGRSHAGEGMLCKVVLIVVGNVGELTSMSHCETESGFLIRDKYMRDSEILEMVTWWFRWCEVRGKWRWCSWSNLYVEPKQIKQQHSDLSRYNFRILRHLRLCAPIQERLSLTMNPTSHPLISTTLAIYPFARLHPISRQLSPLSFPLHLHLLTLPVQEP